MYNKKTFYEFMMAYKHNSAFLINNFLRGHSYTQYRNGEAHSFDLFTGNVDLNQWGNQFLYLNIIEYIFENEKMGYWGINDDYIYMVYNFANCMSDQPPLRDEITVYRGCNSLEIDGLNGIVSTSKDEEIAKQFNRGTLLKIKLPKGMKFIDVDKVRPRKSDDLEKEVILPPCDYKIINDKVIKIKGPNNPSGETRVIEVEVTPKDLLHEFANSLLNPPDDYIKNYCYDDTHTQYFHNNINIFFNKMLSHTVDSCDSTKKIRGTGLYGQADVIKRKALCGAKKGNKTNMNACFNILSSKKPLPSNVLESMKYRINFSTLPKQISPIDFYNYIKNSKDKFAFYDYANTDEHKNFYSHQDHGIIHADNTTMFTYYIAEKEGYSRNGIRILLDAARHHDIGRENGFEDPKHGINGAIKYDEEYKEELPLFESVLVKFLILSHNLQDRKSVRILANNSFGHILNGEQLNIVCDMAYILRDADALDRTRFPISSPDYLDSRFLEHDSAKELIEVAQTLNYKEQELLYKNNNRKNEKHRHTDVAPNSDGRV